jgi:hypothetical protein
MNEDDKRRDEDLLASILVGEVAAKKDRLFSDGINELMVKYNLSNVHDHFTTYRENMSIRLNIKDSLLDQNLKQDIIDLFNRAYD